MNYIRNIGLLYRTLKYLKYKQLFFQVFYRICKTAVKRKLFVKFHGNTNALKLSDFIQKPNSFLNNNFTFLKLTIAYSSIQTIDWDETEHGKLWAYNLNYFDFLMQQNIDFTTGLSLIESFIDKYPQLSEAIEPYPISLRGINWIKWLSKSEVQELSNKSIIDESLWQQYQLLSRNIEYHLLGNHLLENGFSILFGAFYFNDAKLYAKARRILLHELKEQILPDGAHFELSPMYHQIMLDRLLDAINLLQHNPCFANQDDLLQQFTIKASIMLGWLQQITFSNGDIPLVNDSARGIAPSTYALEEYAARVGIIPRIEPLKECGYRVFRNDKYEVILDCGIPGPDYIPGHAHADIFNFVLYAGGNPIIVDTGTSTYNVGQTRMAERSTAAHNTVMVNNIEQSEIWSAFRMGRRVKPHIIIDGQDLVLAFYKGLSYTHKRSFHITDLSVSITDTIDHTNAKAIAYFHFYPGILIERFENQIISDNFKFTFNGSEDFEVGQYQYAVAFNQQVVAPVLKVHFTKKLETLIEFK